MTKTSSAKAIERAPSQKQRVAQHRGIGNVARRSILPENLERPEVEALIHAAPHRAGVRKLPLSLHLFPFH